MKSIGWIIFGVIIGSTVGGFTLADEYNIDLTESIGIGDTKPAPLNQTASLKTPTNTKPTAPILEPQKQIPFKDCDQFEKLKKDWFDCVKYNQDIGSDRLAEKRVKEGKEISRGF